MKPYNMVRIPLLSSELHVEPEGNLTILHIFLAVGQIRVEAGSSLNECSFNLSCIGEIHYSRAPLYIS